MTSTKAAASVSDRAWAEAAAWVVRLHGSQRSAAMESGWRRWLDEHPDHLAAWELASDSWEESHDIPVSLVHPPVRIAAPAVQRRFKPGLVALAALLVGVTLIGVIHFTGGREVTTAVGEQRTLSLDDGTRIELNTDSSVVVQYDDHTRQITLRSGEAYFQVAPERRPFKVLAGDRQIVALGTAFTVRREPDQVASPLTVTLIEGRVAVAPVDTMVPHAAPPASSPEVTVLSAGERLRVQPQGSVVDVPAIDKLTAWTRGELVFDSVSLREAVVELNRYSHIKVTLASHELGELPVGGIFRAGDSLSFARAVSQTYDLSFTRHNTEIVLGPKRTPSQAGTAADESH
jgi:transmembrane sensor